MKLYKNCECSFIFSTFSNLNRLYVGQSWICAPLNLMLHFVLKYMNNDNTCVLEVYKISVTLIVMNSIQRYLKILRIWNEISIILSRERVRQPQGSRSNALLPKRQAVQMPGPTPGQQTKHMLTLRAVLDPYSNMNRQALNNNFGIQLPLINTKQPHKPAYSKPIIGSTIEPLAVLPKANRVDAQVYYIKCGQARGSIDFLHIWQHSEVECFKFNRDTLIFFSLKSFTVNVMNI